MDSFVQRIKTKTIEAVKLLLILTTLIQPIVKRRVEHEALNYSSIINFFSLHSSTFAWTASNRENFSVMLAKFSAKTPRSATIPLLCLDVKTGSTHPFKNKSFWKLFYIQYSICNLNLFYYFHTLFCCLLKYFSTPNWNQRIKNFFCHFVKINFLNHNFPICSRSNLCSRKSKKAKSWTLSLLGVGVLKPTVAYLNLFLVFLRRLSTSSV